MRVRRVSRAEVAGVMGSRVGWNGLVCHFGCWIVRPHCYVFLLKISFVLLRHRPKLQEPSGKFNIHG